LTTGVRFGWRQAIEKENFNEDQLPDALDRPQPALRQDLRQGPARRDLRNGVQSARPRRGRSRSVRRHRVLHHAMCRGRRQGPRQEGHQRHRQRHGRALGAGAPARLQGHGQQGFLLPEDLVREARAAEAHAQAHRQVDHGRQDRRDPRRPARRADRGRAPQGHRAGSGLRAHRARGRDAHRVRARGRRRRRRGAGRGPQGQAPRQRLVVLSALSPIYIFRVVCKGFLPEHATRNDLLSLEVTHRCHSEPRLGGAKNLLARSFVSLRMTEKEMLTCNFRRS